MTEHIGPDCRDGNKHRACDGRAFDETRDTITTCDCPCHWDTLQTEEP